MVWKSVKNLPIGEDTYLLLTVNNKVMVISNRELTSWTVEKYQVTHYIRVIHLVNLPKI